MTLEDFSSQMERMAEAGYRGVSVGRALDGLKREDGNSSRDVVLTFDDGNRSDCEHALPILAGHGFAATFFITVNRVGDRDGLGEPEIRTLCAAGMEVGSHGMTHRFLTSLSKAGQEDECRRSKDLLTEITGSDVRFFSVPGGRYTGETIHILRAASYEGVCTSRFGYSRLDADRWALKRIPVTRSTTRGQFSGILERSPRVVLPAYVGAASRVMTRRVLGEGLYARLRSRMIEE